MRSLISLSRGWPEVLPLPGGDPLSIPSLARDVSQRFLIWDAFVGGRRRIEAHPLVLPAAMHQAAVWTAERVADAIGRVAARAHVEERERDGYRVSDDVRRLARASFEAGDLASLVRVDLLLRENGEWAACEVNADCPGGHNEGLGLPRLARAAGYLEGRDPTFVTSALARRLVGLAGGRAVGLIYATAYAEDLQVCALLQRTLTEMGVRAVLGPPTAPRMTRGDLCLGGAPLGALYRFFPTEYMTGQTNVDAIAEAVRQGRIRTVSSFAHIFAQSKLAFARAWKDKGVLSEDDRAAVTQHTAETFDVTDVPRGELAEGSSGWVLKRAYGRVGDDVFVGRSCRARRGRTSWTSCSRGAPRASRGLRNASSVNLRSTRRGASDTSRSAPMSSTAASSATLRGSPLKATSPTTRCVCLSFIWIPRSLGRSVPWRHHAPKRTDGLVRPLVFGVSREAVDAFGRGRVLGRAAPSYACRHRDGAVRRHRALGTAPGQSMASLREIDPPHGDRFASVRRRAPRCQRSRRGARGPASSREPRGGGAAAAHAMDRGRPRGVVGGIWRDAHPARAHECHARAHLQQLARRSRDDPGRGDLVGLAHHAAANRIGSRPHASHLPDGCVATCLPRRSGRRRRDRQPLHVEPGRPACPEVLVEQGIRRIVYVVESRDETDTEEDDLHETFYAYQSEGIRVSMVDFGWLAQLGDRKGTGAQRPWDAMLGSCEYRVVARATLVKDPRFYLRARGGFGGVAVLGFGVGAEASGAGGGFWVHGGHGHGGG